MAEYIFNLLVIVRIAGTFVALLLVGVQADNVSASVTGAEALTIRSGTILERGKEVNQPLRLVKGHSEIISQEDAQAERSSWEVWAERGNAFFDRGDFAKAIESYSHGIRVDEGNSALYQLRAYARATAGEFEGALEDYDRAVALGYQYPVVFLERGAVKGYLKLYEGAIEDISRYIMHTPMSPRGYDARGDAYFDNAEYNLAEQDYRRAISIIKARRSHLTGRNAGGFSFQELMLYRKLAELRQVRGDAVGASKELETAIGLNPEYYEAYNDLAWLLVTTTDNRVRDVRRALEYARKANELSEGKNADVLDTLAEVYYRNKHYEEAISAARAALELRPDDADLQESLETFERASRNRSE